MRLEYLFNSNSKQVKWELYKESGIVKGWNLIGTHCFVIAVKQHFGPANANCQLSNHMGKWVENASEMGGKWENMQIQPSVRWPITKTKYTHVCVGVCGCDTHTHTHTHFLRLSNPSFECVAFLLLCLEGIFFFFL